MSSRGALPFLIVAGCLVMGMSAATASRQVPVFQAQANFIEVDAIVTDASGAFVRGLTRDDFEITEDKQPQTIATCSLVDLPMDIAGETPPPAPLARIPSDISSNADDGRIYIIAIDALNMDVSGGHKLRSIVAQFVQNYLGPHDLAAVMRLDFLTMQGYEFTSDKARLLSSPVLSAWNYSSGAGETLGAGAKNEQMLNPLAAAVQYLAGLRGRRKTLILFSEGIPTDVYDAMSEAGRRTAAAERELIKAAARANVNLYTIDPRGTAVVDPFAEEQPAFAREWESLRMLADDTGGRASVGYNEFREPFTQLVADNSSYYVLSYGSPHVGETKDQFHAITVRVKRPGLTVLARNGWYAPSTHTAKAIADLSRAWANTDLTSLLLRPLPTTCLGLVLRAAAAPVGAAGAFSHVAVTLEVDGAGLSFRSRGQTFDDDVEVGYRVAHSDGVPVAADRAVVPLRLTAAVHDAVVRTAWRYQREIDLKPGAYQLRLAARDAAGRAGTVFVDLDVPDVVKVPLSMGRVVLASKAPVGLTSGALPTLRAILPGPPTTTRTFASTDTLTAFSRIVDSDVKHPHSVEIAATVRTEAGTEVFRAGQTRDAATLRASAPGYVTAIPLGGLPAGRYVLTISAQSSLDKTAITRDVPFAVR